LPIFGKIRRRVWLPIIASGCMTVVMLVKCFKIYLMEWNWWLFISIWASVGLCYLSYSVFSYGKSSFLRPLGKWAQRFIVHGIHAASWFLIPIFTGQWIVFGLGVFMSAIVGMFLGALNPMHAPEEEGMIGETEFAYTPFLI
jgi:hypothetical protein